MVYHASTSVSGQPAQTVTQPRHGLTTPWSGVPPTPTNHHTHTMGTSEAVLELELKTMYSPSCPPHPPTNSAASPCQTPPGPSDSHPPPATRYPSAAAGRCASSQRGGGRTVDTLGGPCGTDGRTRGGAGGGPWCGPRRGRRPGPAPPAAARPPSATRPRRHVPARHVPPCDEAAACA